MTKTTTTTTIDECKLLLCCLHLGHIIEILDGELAEAVKQGLSYTDLLIRVLRAQWHHRSPVYAHALGTRPLIAFQNWLDSQEQRWVVLGER